MLKDGTEPLDPRLDRLYEEDWNSLNFPVTAVLEQRQPYEEYEPESFTWSVGRFLDQGKEGACVGFGHAHEALARPNVVRIHNGAPIDAAFARDKIYFEAQKIDEWPGGSYPGATPVYEGTSVLAGAKVMQSLGIYSSYYWALDLKQLALAVSYVGPAVMGLKWYEGMFTPDSQFYIHPTGRLGGGHCLLANGVEIVWTDPAAEKVWENVDKNKSFFRLHNSWGPNWAARGGCFITFKEMEQLLLDDGDACIPVRAN